jgi:hypothetical protein
VPSKKRRRRQKFEKLTFGPDSPLPPELRQRLEQIDMNQFRDILDNAKGKAMTKEEHAIVAATVMSLAEAHKILDEVEEANQD